VFGYIVRRLLSAFLVIVLTSMFVFLLFFKGPTNPAIPACNLNGKCTPAKLAILTEQMGLNDTYWHQYGVWAKGLFTGREIQFGATYQCDAPCLGISFRTKTQVTEDLKQKFPATLSLAIGASLIYLVLGVTLGTIAARYRATLTDRGLVAFSVFISAIPYYVIALLAWIYLTQSFGLFPANNTPYNAFSDNPATWAWHLLLPWMVIGLTFSTQYARFSRGQMIETMGEDFIRTATAKGLPGRQVMLRHGLRAAIVPIITIFGLDFAGLLAGTIFTEVIFQIDGMGQWAVQSVFAPTDFPVVAATVLVAAVIVVIANLVVDLLYSVIDPRVRLE
jgi:peptide/nickel transport system permease protein